MKFLLSHLLTERGTQRKHPTSVSVTLQTEGRLLYAFPANGSPEKITPHLIEFSLDGVRVKGISEEVGGRFYYAEWWLRPA